MPTSASPSSRPSSPNPFPQLGSLPKDCRFFNCLPSLGLESEVRETGGFLDHIRRDPQGEGGRPLRGGHRLRVDGEAPGHQPRGCGKTAAGVPRDREGRAAWHGARDLRLGGEGRAPEHPLALVALAGRQLAVEQVGDAPHLGRAGVLEEPVDRLVREVHGPRLGAELPRVGLGPYRHGHTALPMAVSYTRGFTGSS